MENCYSHPNNQERIKLFSILWLMLLPAFSHAQLTLIKDINTTPNTNSFQIGNFSSYPTGYFEWNGATYFSAKDANGTELWKTDNTGGGTVLVKDIRPGNGSSSPIGFFVLNGALFFTADDGIHGQELWKTDGSPAGTVMVKDINPGSQSSNIICGFCGQSRQYVILNNKVYFSANDGAIGPELWESDGTEQGTKLLKDIRIGASGSGPSQFTDFGNGFFYFAASTADNGNELWRSDGTKAGTQLVKDITTGTSGSNPSNLTLANGKIIFSAYNSTFDNELYVSDGTEAGTSQLLNINASSSSNPSGFIMLNNVVYFFANDGIAGNELWKTDGTLAGTAMVKDIEPGAGSVFADLPVIANGKIFFRLFTSANGSELWSTDGTEAGTIIVKDIVPGSGSSSVQNVASVGGTIFFSAATSGSNNELWKSDGTEAGTSMVLEIRPGSDGSSPYGFASSGGKTIFTATTSIGTEVWTTDGTAGGTALLKDILNANNSSLQGYSLRIGNKVFFSADDGINGNELWMTDGTDLGTTMVKDMSPGALSSYFNYFTEANGLLFFHANNGLWRSDGTSLGTYQLLSGYGSYEMVNIGGTLFFNWYDNTNGQELWKSDGTIGGTVKVKDIDPSGTNSAAQGLINVNGIAFFYVNDGVNGTELWKSDGTPAGTQLVKVIVPGTSDDYSFRLYAYNNMLLFWVNDGTNGVELWKSDGTELGTVLVKDINPGASGSFYSNSTAIFNGEFYFPANTSTNGRELWKTDGTTAGTVMVKDIVPGSASSTPGLLMPLASTLVFSTTDPSDNSALWKTDGTSIGTTEITKIEPRLLQRPVSGTNIAYFVGQPLGSTWQTWRTDGTAQGSFAVTNFEAYPMDFLSGDNFVMQINDLVTGSEPWLYSPTSINPEIGIARSYNEIQNGDTYNFGVVETMGSSANIGLSITNSGTAALLISQISVTGANASDFVINQSATKTKLDPGTGTTFLLKFTPAAFGARSAVLTVQSNDSDEGSFQINLSGEGGPKSQTITFGALPVKTYGQASFSVSATASSTLPVSYASSNVNVATVLGNTISIVGAGTTNITASQAGDATFLPAEDAVQVLTVNKAQLTAKASDASRSYGQTNPAFAIQYTGFVNGDDENDLDAPSSGTTVATAASDVGDYDIDVVGGSDANYIINPDVTKGKLTISKAQLIARAVDANKIYGAINPDFEIQYTGFVNDDDDDDLDELPSTSTTTSATSDVGEYEVDVIGGSDLNYDIMPDLTKGKLTIGKAQLIVKAQDESRNYGEANPTFVIIYDGFVNDDDEGDLDELPVASTVATETSDAGVFDIDVSGGDDNNYLIVADVNKGQLTVNAISQTITFTSLASKYLTDPDFTLEASSTSGLTVTFSSSDETVATVTGNVVHLVGAGTTTITASQAGDQNYLEASPVAQDLKVTILQTISFGPLSNKVFGEAPFALTASASSGLTVTYHSDNEEVATISGNMVTLVGVGTATITASQAGDALYEPAPDVAQVLTVNQTTQTISFDVITDKSLGDPAFILSASATSGLNVEFSTSSDKITISGSEVTLVSAGRVTITADQEGNDLYQPAESVERSFCILPAKPVIAVNLSDISAPVLTSSSPAGNQWFLDGDPIASATGASHTVTARGSYQVVVSVDDCVSEPSEVKAFVVTGDDAVASNEPISIYPNPVLHTLYIRLGAAKRGPAEINIMDATGKAMKQLTNVTQEEVAVDFHDAPAGVYFVRVMRSNQLSHVRFVKK